MLEDFYVDIKGRPIAYDGNDSLKRCNVKLPYTKAHIDEIIKCKNDWKHFAQNYYHITSLDEGVIKIKTRYYQDNIINNFINNRFNIVLSSRQSGKSTSYEIFCLWYVLFQESKTIAILANKLETAVGILSKIKMAYELLPNYLKQGVKKWNEKSIEMENGCKIIASATSSSAIRSKSVNVLILDEQAFVPTKQWEKFYSSVYPTISSSQDSKIIIVSTPNGLNQFYKFWNDAIKGVEGIAGKGNKFIPYRVDWWEVPGRDEAWKQETIANTSQKEFDTEYGNCFQGSAATLLESHIFNTLSAIEPLDNSKLILTGIAKKYQNYLKIYNTPEENHTYIVSLDAAKMTENSNGDAISIQILDITHFPFKQVGTLLISEGVSYLEMDDVAIAIAELYNKAYLFIENNEGAGQSIADKILDKDYKNLYQQKDGVAGYRTTTKTKKLGCTNLKFLIENQRLLLQDQVTITQLSTFVKIRNTYKADIGYQDDAVMALIGAIFFMQDKEFEGITDIDYVNGVIKREEEDDTTTPIPLIIAPFLEDEEQKVEMDWSWLGNYSIDHMNRIGNSDYDEDF